MVNCAHRTEGKLPDRTANVNVRGAHCRLVPVVGRIPAGAADPAAILRAIAPVGSRVGLEGLMARKRAIKSVAVPGLGLSLSSSCMARMPKGVSAWP